MGLPLVNVRSRFELCVILTTRVARYLFNITSNLPLCGGNPNEGWREAERNLRRWALCATHRHQNPSRCPSSVPKLFAKQDLAFGDHRLHPKKHCVDGLHSFEPSSASNKDIPTWALTSIPSPGQHSEGHVSVMLHSTAHNTPLLRR